jgi:protein SCO1/2
MLAQVKHSLADLPPAQQPQVLFVSVDPERDDAKQLAAYVTFFDPAFVGASGSASQVKAAAAAFSVPYARVPTPDGGYTMDHGSGIFIVGPTAGLEALGSGARDPAALARDYRLVVDYAEQTR